MRYIGADYRLTPDSAFRKGRFMYVLKSFLAGSFAVGALIRAFVVWLGDGFRVDGSTLKALYAQQSGMLAAIGLSMAGGLLITLYFQAQRQRRVKKN